MIHFLRPYWFLLLPPLMYLCWRLNALSSVNNWRKVCDAHLLPHLLVQQKGRLKWPIGMLALGFLFTVVSLAGPSWHQEKMPIYRTSQGVVIALNLSSSMKDSIGATTKIDRARFKLLDYLRNQKQMLTGLVVYTDEAHIISPLTEDSSTIANFIPALDPSIMPTTDDDTPVSLTTAGELFTQAGVNYGAVLLVTDKVTHEAATRKLARSLRSQGYQLIIFALTEDQQVLDTLNDIAKSGGGRVIALTSNNQDIEQLQKAVTVTQKMPTKKSNKEGLFWHDDGRWLLWLIVPLALLGFRRGYIAS